MKKIICSLILGAILISTSFAFTDVPKTHWAYEAINNMQNKGVVAGFYDNTFKPDDVITKEQLASIITLGLNLSGETSNTFADVSQNRWSNIYISATRDYFTTYTINGKLYFEPEKPVTREEAATTFVKALGLEKDEVDLSILNEFDDRQDFTNEKYVAIAFKNGVMKGKVGYFDPNATLTRAEIAAIMNNILSKNEENKSTYSDFDFLKYLPKDKNYMASPFSIKMAMMMLANGSSGTTKNEILNAFGISDIDSYNEYAKNTIESYNNDADVKLNVANSIWINKDIVGVLAEFNESYKELIESNFDGTANTVGNSNAVSKINSWCSEKTNGKINKIINSSDFASALVNAIYFKGSWAEQFNKSATQKDKFMTIKNKEVEKDFMHKTDHYGYYEDETMQLVSVPYKGYKTSMYIVLPKVDESDLSFENAINNMKNRRVALSIPKFKIEYEKSLVDVLKEMGVKRAFDPSGAEIRDTMFINVLNNIYVSDVIHKTYIDVDEEGTEAAAVTAIIMKATAAYNPEEPIEFTADRPFIYFIRDNESGAILFMGRLVE
ncbi:MAG: S-layer homology domain-containing protein [Clostridia bacterium]|nr:S-layer homology domain-containing protein [Clostridia bacterium]